MEYRYNVSDPNNSFLEVAVEDYALINHSLLNKGMAFTVEERDDFNLLGLLPTEVTDLATQRERSFIAFTQKSSDIEKYIYLRDLQNSNETLFHSLLTHYLEEMLPIVYTPTVGLGCQQFSQIYRRPRGVFISYPYRHQIEKMLANERFDRVKVIVVTDGERILGLGDQGAGGMGISIGKLSLYTACAGIHPTYTLPLLLDNGTNNEGLLNDPLYLGWRHERIRGAEYDEFVDLFIRAVKNRFPHALLQWEDFAQVNANPILARYRHELCTFNDDIQGTAAVAAGTLFSAIKVNKEALTTQNIVIVGAGSAGCGIADLIVRAMVDEGLSLEAAKSRIYLVDRTGLLCDDMPELLPFQQKIVASRIRVQNWIIANPAFISLAEVVQNAKATILLGVSGQANIFNESLVRMMSAQVARPIIFPLSNPPSKCEANPADLMLWSEGRAIISTGSPYPPVIKNGKPFRIDQTNNCYIFPGLGLATLAIKACYITDQMFMIAARALAQMSPVNDDPEANLLPPLDRIRDVSLHVAIEVAKEAINAGLAKHIPMTDLKTYIKNYMWDPKYLVYKPMPK